MFLILTAKSETYIYILPKELILKSNLKKKWMTAVNKIFQKEKAKASKTKVYIPYYPRISFRIYKNKK